MNRLRVITNSEVEDFDRCPAYWGYRYPEGLRAEQSHAAITYGDLYHAGCEAGWHAGWQDPGLPIESRRQAAQAAAMLRIHQYAAELRLNWTGTDEEEAELVENTEVAQWATFHYFAHPSTDLHLVPLAIEATFSVPIPTRAGQGGSLRQSGKMDLVLWDREAAQIVLEDHKTTGYAVQVFEGKLALLPQPTGYLRALGMLLDRVWTEGWWGDHPGTGFWAHTTPAAMHIMQAHRGDILGSSTGAIAFNVSRRAKPSQPDINKLRLAKGILAVNPRLAALQAAQEEDKQHRGEVSVAQIDTLPEVYEAALVEQESARGLPRTDAQVARLESLKGKPSTFFQRYEFYRGPEELERWRREMWVKSRAIRAAERNPEQRVRNPYSCTGPGAPKCLYAQVCLSPHDPVARAAFRVATERHEELDHDAGHGTQRTGQPGPGSPAERF